MVQWGWEVNRSYLKLFWVGINNVFIDYYIGQQTISSSRVSCSSAQPYTFVGLRFFSPIASRKRVWWHGIQNQLFIRQKRKLSYAKPEQTWTNNVAAKNRKETTELYRKKTIQHCLHIYCKYICSSGLPNPWATCTSVRPLGQLWGSLPHWQQTTMCMHIYAFYLYMFICLHNI